MGNSHHNKYNKEHIISVRVTVTIINITKNILYVMVTVAIINEKKSVSYVNVQQSP